MSQVHQITIVANNGETVKLMTPQSAAGTGVGLELQGETDAAIPQTLQLLTGARI